MIKNEKGLTLVEVLAAAAILGMIVTVFVTISGYTQLSFNKSDQKAASLRLAESKLNEIRNAIPVDPPIPNVGTQNQPTTPVSGFNVTVNETALTSTPVYSTPIPEKNQVSLQGVVLLNNNGTYVPRLITVTVSWEGSR